MINKKKLNELVAKVQSGDKNSFWDIYDILLDPIYNFVFFKVSHKELAEDLTEETFIKVWDNFSKFKSLNNIPFSAWVYKIAGNLISDYYRKFSRETYLDPDQEIQDTNSAKEVKQDAEISLNQKLLAKALQKINWDQKDIIILKYVNDLSYWEISTITEKPEWTVRQLHSRALKNLKEIMKDLIE